jgi:hypothetical protein
MCSVACPPTPIHLHYFHDSAGGPSKVTGSPVPQVPQNPPSLSPIPQVPRNPPSRSLRNLLHHDNHRSPHHPRRISVRLAVPWSNAQCPHVHPPH